MMNSTRIYFVRYLKTLQSKKRKKKNCVSRRPIDISILNAASKRLGFRRIFSAVHVVIPKTLNLPTSH